MNNNHVLLSKRNMLFLGAIAIAFLFVSSATLVPRVEGAAVNDQIDTIADHNDLIRLLETFDSMESADEQQRLKATSLLLTIISEIISAPQDLTEYNAEDRLIESASNILKKTITPQEIEQQKEETATILTDSLSVALIEQGTPQQQGILSNLLKNLITKMLSNIINLDAINAEGMGSIISTLFSLFTGLPALLLQLIGQGLSIILQAIIRVFRALVSIIVIIITGIQLGLTLGGLFFIFLGIVSKLGIKAFSVIGAPLFAVMSFMFSLATGNLFGGISLIFNSAIGFIITFLIPIVLIALVIYFIINNSNTDGGIDIELREGGFLYMIVSIMGNLLGSTTA